MTRRSVPLALAVIIVMALPQTASAFGYKDTGFDADDRPWGEGCCATDPDIRTTTRTVWADRQGRAWLTVTVRTYDYLWEGYQEFFVRLDTRGGPLADHRMGFGYMPLQGTYCWVRPTTSHRYRVGEWLSPGNLEINRMSCRVPLRWVEPNKQIRWGVFSPDQLTDVDEWAPARSGWYP